MSSFRDVAKRGRAAAASLGIRATMSRINDALAFACHGRPYASVLAAESAGRLEPMPSVPRYLTKAARKYQIPANALGQALHTALEGELAPAGGGVIDALEWIAGAYPGEFEKMKNANLLGLASEAVIRSLAQSEHGITWYMVFADWLIAEGFLPVEGRLVPVIDVLDRENIETISMHQRRYLRALSIAPLRAYLVESVVPGFTIRLRQLGATEVRTVVVRERTGSVPSIVGATIGARIVAIDDHLEFAAGLMSFSPASASRMTNVLRSVTTNRDSSHAIRSHWIEQFDAERRPATRVVSSDGEPIVFVTDTYLCTDIGLFSNRMAADPRIHGDAQHGWAIQSTGPGGRTTFQCSISLAEGAAERITVVYHSIKGAATWRSEIEAIAAGLLHHLQRCVQTVEDVLTDSNKVPESPYLIPPDALTGAIEAAVREHYANWADEPLPYLDDLTPRQAIGTSEGLSRVHELLAMYESNERRLAEQDGREAFSYAFLYDAVGISRPAENAAVEATSDVLHPTQFYVNEAWVVFQLMEASVATSEGQVGCLALMDAASTCILNFATERADVPVTKLEARRLLTQFDRISPPPPRPARILYVPTSLAATAITIEAASIGMEIRRVHEDTLLPIIGAARASLQANLASKLGSHI